MFDNDENIELIDHYHITTKDTNNSNNNSNTNILIITTIKDTINNSLEKMKNEVRLKMIATNSLRFEILLPLLVVVVVLILILTLILIILILE